MKLTQRSPCKVNLVLNLLGLRPDGFHELETLFFPVPLFDELSVETIESDSAQRLTFILSCSNSELPVDSSNLVHRAAASFLQVTGIRTPIRMHLEKNLPLAAGIGGGSANAAVTLRLLNRFFGTPLDFQSLNQIAAGLGSDVNFFLQDLPAIGRGRGEQIEPLPSSDVLQGKSMVLYHPGFGVSTPWTFKQLADFPDARNGRPGRAMEVAQSFLSGDWSAAAASLYNGLEGPVLRKYPILRLYQEFFRQHGAAATLMSGSGSTTFAIFDHLSQAEAILPAFTESFGTAGWFKVVPCVLPTSSVSTDPHDSHVTY